VSRAVAALAVAVVLAGCGGEERLPTLAFEEEQLGSQARRPGQVVLQFVEAARAGDGARMALLLSASTYDTLGPGALRDIADDFAEFVDGRVVLSLRLDDGWAVGAVAGRSEEDGDPAAYAAALRLEDGAWRLELGGVVFGRLRPGPLDETDALPELRAEAQAGGEIEDLLVWVDGRPVRGFARHRRFTAEVRGRLGEPLAPGRHMVIVFATAAETAGALAWPFEVAE
jgi:hypothetical protein